MVRGGNNVRGCEESHRHHTDPSRSPLLCRIQGSHVHRNPHLSTKTPYCTKTPCPGPHLHLQQWATKRRWLREGLCHEHGTTQHGTHSSQSVMCDMAAPINRGISNSEKAAINIALGFFQQEPRALTTRGRVCMRQLQATPKFSSTVWDSFGFESDFKISTSSHSKLCMYNMYAHRPWYTS
jgi:hypothetical protein